MRSLFTFAAANKLVELVTGRTRAEVGARSVLTAHVRRCAVMCATCTLVDVLTPRADRIQLEAWSTLLDVATDEAALRVDARLRTATRVARRTLVHVDAHADRVSLVAAVAHDSLTRASGVVHAVADGAAFGEAAE